MRIGWPVSRNREIIDGFKLFRDYTTIYSSAPSEILAIIALEARDRIIKTNKEIIHNNLMLLEIFFSKNIKLFSYYQPIAGLICYPKLREDINIGEFCCDLVDKQEVLLLPSNVYGDNSNHLQAGLWHKQHAQGTFPAK